MEISRSINIVFPLFESEELTIRRSLNRLMSKMRENGFEPVMDVRPVDELPPQLVRLGDKAAVIQVLEPENSNHQKNIELINKFSMWYMEFYQEAGETYE